MSTPSTALRQEVSGVAERPPKQKRRDIKTESFLRWDEYRQKKPDEALSSIYSYITATSRQIREWYWKSISTKRTTSLTVRSCAFALLVCGTGLQIYASAFDSAADRLVVTQISVVSLVVAALMLTGDRVFGWSTGWIRYVTTVTTMENLTRAFQLEWASYLLSKTTPLDEADTKKLFDLARALEQELLKLQAEETTKWVAEFNAGISLLESAIKTQREETEKKIDAIRTTLSTQEAAAKLEQKSKAPGALEVALTFKAEPRRVRIRLDESGPVEFLGTSWSKLDIAPGSHTLTIVTMTEPSHSIEKVVEIPPGGIARVEVKLAV